MTANASPDRLINVLHESHQGVHRFQLDNGMDVLIKPVHEVPVVSIQIWLGTGSIHEGKFLGSGLSHYVEHMYFKGTENLSTGDIWQKISGPGGQMNAYTTLDRTVFYTDLPASHWKQGLDVLGEAAMNASFPEDEWEKEQQVILREMAMGEDSPDRVLSKLLFQTALREHPMRHPVIGYRDVFLQRDRDDLIEFFEEHYTPENMMLVLVGDIDKDEAESAVRELFSDFERSAREPVILPEEPTQLSPRTARKTGDYQITRVGMTWQGVSLTHPDAPALDVLAEVLGSGRSSILSQALKEQNPLALSISSWSYTPESHGMFGVSASCLPENEEALVKGIREIVYGQVGEQLTEEGLAKAKRRLLSQEILSMETINGQARSIASGAFYTGDPEFSIRYLESIQNVTLEEIQQMAEKYFKSHGETFVALSPKVDSEEEADAEKNELQAVQRVNTGLGFPLLFRQDSRLPKVYFSIVFGGGLILESPEMGGATRLVSQLLTRGTDTRTSADLAEQIESRGGAISGFSGNHSFGLNASCLSDDVELFAELIRDCIQNSVFDPAEVDKQKTLQMGQIKSENEKPTYHAFKELKESVYGDHPFARSASGSLESVEAQTSESLKAFYKSLASRENVAVSVFGDISEVQALELVRSIFKDLSAEPPPAMGRGTFEPSLASRLSQVLPFQQDVFAMGYTGLRLTDPRADALSIIDRAMSGLASDLGVEIREKRGLVYYVGASQTMSIDPGVFFFYAGTRNDALEKVEKLVREQVKRLRKDGLREDEFERGRNQLRNEFFKSLESNQSLAQTCAIYERVAGGFENYMNTLDRLEEVTLDDIQKVAQDVFNPDFLAVSIVRSQEPEE